MGSSSFCLPGLNTCYKCFTIGSGIAKHLCSNLSPAPGVDPGGNKTSGAEGDKHCLVKHLLGQPLPCSNSACALC